MDPRERLAEIEQEMRDLHEQAGDSSFDETQQTRWDQLSTERGEVQETIRRDEQRREEARQLASQPGHTESGDGPREGGPQVMRRVEPFDGSDVRSLPTRDARDKALKALEDRDTTSHLDQRQMDGLDRTLRKRNRDTDGSMIARRLLLTENEHYRSAFMKMMARPNAVLTNEEGRAVQQFDEFRAMNIGTDSAGGFGIPVVIDPTIVLTSQGHPNDFLNLARVEVITNDEWKGVTSAGVTWSFDGEATEVSDDSPSLSQPAVTTHKAQGFIPYSIEVGMDYPGFASEMSMLLAEGYSELLVDNLTTGSGTGQPTGIITALTGTSSEIDAGTTGSITASDINGLWSALPIKYRGNAAWMSHTEINNAIQQLGSGNNDSAFTVDFTAEGVFRLKGRRMYLNDYMATFPSGSAVNGEVIVGDWSNFLIAQRAGMSVENVPHLFGSSNRPTGERGWYAWARVGSDSINDAAFRMLSDDNV